MTQDAAHLTRHTLRSQPRQRQPNGVRVNNGSAQVRSDFQRFVSLVETGRLDLGSMVSAQIGLDDVNDAFRAMQAGEVIRSVITHV